MGTVSDIHIYTLTHMGIGRRESPFYYLFTIQISSLPGLQLPTIHNPDNETQEGDCCLGIKLS